MRIVRLTWVLSSFTVEPSLCLSVLSLCVVCCCGARGRGRGGGGGGREEEGGGEEKGDSKRTIWAKVSLKIAETEQLYQVKRLIVGIGVLNLLLKLENGKDPTVSLVNL